MDEYDEWDMFVDEHNVPDEHRYRFPWLKPVMKICDCGGDKAKTTHSRWCTKWEDPFK